MLLCSYDALNLLGSGDGKSHKTGATEVGRASEKKTDVNPPANVQVKTMENSMNTALELKDIQNVKSSPSNVPQSSMPNVAWSQVRLCYLISYYSSYIAWPLSFVQLN